MLSSDAAECPPAAGSASQGSSYYSCADVSIGDTGVSSKPVSVSDGGTTSIPKDAGKTTSDAGGGGTTTQPGGCHASGHARGVPSEGLLVALPLFVLLRKPRRA